MKMLKQHKDKVPENGHWMFRMECRYGELVYDVYGVVKHTPMGCWVVPSWVDCKNDDDINKYKKFIRSGAKKKFCYPTRKEAENAFYFRKYRQILILKKQLEYAEEAFVKVGGKLPVVPKTRSYDYY